jgi:hypothetical protein
MNTYIYALECPTENTIKYIGKSNNPVRRLKDHMCDFRQEFNKATWIRKLKHDGKKPNLVILDEVPLEKWEFWEQFYIEYFKSLGIVLLNYHKGGNGLGVGNHKTFKLGNVPHNKKVKI